MISIVTPSFNQGAYLEQTILSVLEQNYPCLEYIIIDGGSTDNTLEIIKKYEKFLTYWVSEPDKGMYDAIQKGFEKSSGEIMAWINSDDMYHKGAFSIVADIFTQIPDVEWLTGTPTMYDEYGRCIRVSMKNFYSKYEYFLLDEPVTWIQQESTFWRRSLWNRAGGRLNTLLKYAGDFELWMRFFRYAKHYSTEAIIGGYRRRQGNKQLSVKYFDKYLEEVKSIVKSELQTLTQEEVKLLKKIKLYKKILNMTKRININSLKEYYFNLFGYSDIVTFDSENLHFFKKKSTYFRYQLLDY